MSETFPFGADSDAGAAGDDGRKKLLVVLGGVVALALLAVFVVMPMLGGGDDDTVTPVRRSTKKTTAAKAPAKPAAPAAAKPVAPVTTFKESFERDPFKPLYVAPVGGGNAAPKPGVGGSTGGTTAPAPGTPAAPASSAQIGTNRVSLVDVFVRDGKTFAQTKVNDTVHTPVVGTDFAGNYRLLGASGTCATYLFGDEQFRLCEGQEVLK